MTAQNETKYGKADQAAKAFKEALDRGFDIGDAQGIFADRAIEVWGELRAESDACVEITLAAFRQEKRAIASEQSSARLAERVAQLEGALKLAEEYLTPRVGNQIGSRGQSVILPALRAALSADPSQWLRDAFVKAFVEGVKWWEWQKTGATLWPADRDKAEQEATSRALKESGNG